MGKQKDDNPIGFVIMVVCLFVIVLVIMSAIVSCDVKGSSTSGCQWELEKKKSPFSHSLTKSGPGSRPSFTKTRPQPRPNVKPKPVTPRYNKSHPAPKPSKPAPAGYYYEWDCD